MELFKLLGTIAIDNSGAMQALDNTSAKGNETFSKLSGAFGKIGSAAVKVGKVMATGLATGATAMGVLTMKAMNAAGELEQNMGGSEAVFKESAERMQETAKNAFSNMGLSVSDFLGTANKMGALFQGAGFDIEKSADMSANAMQRAADVASIMGIDVNSAMEAVAGMAKGNFTMMDNLGVAINDTTLQIYAQEKGLGKLETTQDKVNAAYQLFLEKSEYAAGNYKKENETFAGALTTAKAALDNFVSGAGTAEQLADAVVGAADVIIEKLDELFPKLVDGIQVLIQKLTPKIPGILQKVLPGIIQGAVALFNGLVSALPTIIQILAEQIPFIVTQISSAVVQAFPVLLETVKELTRKLWDYISLELLNTGVSFEDAFGKISKVFSDVWGAMQDVWASVGQPIWDMISFAIGSVADLFSKNMPAIKEFFQNAIAGIVDTWQNHLKPALDAIGKYLNDYVKPAFEFVWKSIVEPLVTTVFGTIAELWNNTLKPVFDGICDFLLGVFTDDWKTALQGILNIVVGIFNGIQAAVDAPMDAVKNIVNAAIEFIKNKFNFKWELPKLKLPHFRINGSFSLNPPSVPSFGIDWYKKAMDEPMIMNTPTAFGINKNGQIMAGGEAGSEVVSGTDTLMNMIRDAARTDSNELAKAVRDSILEAFNNLDITANMQVVPDDRGIFRIVEKQAIIKKKATGRVVFQ